MLQGHSVRLPSAQREQPAFSSPPHMETSKQPTRPREQQMCCNKHCSTRSVCTQGSTWNAQQQSLVDCNSPIPGTWEGAMARALKGTNFVDSLSTLPSLTHISLNNYRKPQSFLAKAELMQRDASSYFLIGLCLWKKEEHQWSQSTRYKGKAKSMCTVDLMHCSGSNKINIYVETTLKQSSS